MTRDADDRLDSERSFHDRLFGGEKRRREERVGRFYSVIEGSLAYYRSLVDENCPGRRVLDYGCGEGLWTFYMAERGAQVTAIDISEVAIEEARKRITWLVMDAQDLDFPDRSFDFVCGTAILHHLDLERAYEEVSRVLKEDGRAVFLEPLGHNPLINLYRRLTPDIRTRDEHPLRMEDIELARRYFSGVEARFFHLLSLPLFPLRRFRCFPYLLKASERLEGILFRRFPSLGRYSWMVVLTLSGPRAVTQD